jgi:hypothetical protein
MKRCPECDSELNALVHTVYRFDGEVGEQVSDPLDLENIQAIFCSEDCGFVLHHKQVHDLNQFLDSKNSYLNIIAIYDNGGKSIDRYTIVLNDSNNFESLYNSLGLSNDPDSPLGFSQFNTCENGPHLGKKIAFSDLPKNVQDHAKNRLS